MAPKYPADQMLWQSYLFFGFQYFFFNRREVFFSAISTFHKGKHTVMQSIHFLKRLAELATTKMNFDIVFSHPPGWTSRKSLIRSFFCRPAKSGTKSVQLSLVDGVLPLPRASYKILSLCHGDYSYNLCRI